MKMTEFDAEQWVMNEEERHLWMTIADTIYSQVPEVAKYISKFLDEPICTGFVLRSCQGRLTIFPNHIPEEGYLSETIKRPGQIDEDDPLQYKDPSGTFEGIESC